LDQTTVSGLQQRSHAQGNHDATTVLPGTRKQNTRTAKQKMIKIS